MENDPSNLAGPVLNDTIPYTGRDPSYISALPPSAKRKKGRKSQAPTRILPGFNHHHYHYNNPHLSSLAVVRVGFATSTPFRPSHRRIFTNPREEYQRPTWYPAEIRLQPTAPLISRPFNDRSTDNVQMQSEPINFSPSSPLETVPR